MVIKLISIMLFFSINFSYSINHSIENNNLNFIDNHIIISKSNGTILKNQLVFDIYRLEFIVSNPENIQYNIKNINWVKSDYSISNLGEYNLLDIGDTFNYRGCSSAYVDIFPYKIDNNILYYIESIDIEFNIIENSSQESCYPSHQVFNRDFIIQNELNPINSNGIDYLIITNNNLLDIAENLKDVHNDLNISIVSTDSIYDLYQELDSEYAIREYVINQIDMFSSLNYFLILGDETIVPPIYNGTVPSDDYYTSPNLFSANPQLATGRIPVTNITDADAVISKIDYYIQNISYPIDDNQLWRMNINLISDDENNPNPNKYPELSHTENSNLLYEQIKQNLIVNTFYGIDYEPIQDSDGLLHLDLTNDLIASINNGISMINYIGHGNHHTLADEKIIDMDRDINLINSLDYKLPIWVVGTCSFGEYDGKDSMAEALLLKENSSIAVISTTRGIGETSNINYLTKFFNEINDYVEDISSKDRLGDLLKNSKNNSSSEYLFHLFGDPALPLPFPKKDNIISSIPNELLIGAYTTVDIGPYDANLNVFGKEQDMFRDYGNNDTISYKVPGQSIYAGNFYEEVCFITPLDASECQDCASAYIQRDNTPHNLFQNIFDLDIVFNQDQIEESIDDSNGPEVIFLMEDYRPLYNNDIISDNNNIIVRVKDESGINLMDGLGHSIRYWFNDEQNQNSIDIQAFNYISSCDTTAIGEFSIEPKNLNLGTNILYVEVWDNFNNKTLKSISLILESSLFKAYDVYNFPNPFKDQTHFTFKTSFFPSRATISIFDLSGKRIKIINNYECAESFCSIKWDGRNSSANKINNGTYIYHLKVINGYDTFENLYKITKLK